MHIVNQYSILDLSVSKQISIWGTHELEEGPNHRKIRRGYVILGDIKSISLSIFTYGWKTSAKTTNVHIYTARVFL